MKKFLLMLLMGATFLFASIDLNSANKVDLMSIKGIGEKKALKIIEFRKSKKITNIDDLMIIKGFGPSLIANIKEKAKIK